MGWFRRNKSTGDSDQIFDLNDVVWRGVDRMQRLDRLADDADRVAEHHEGHPDKGPFYPPKHPTSLIDEVIMASSPQDWAQPNAPELNDSFDENDTSDSDHTHHEEPLPEQPASPPEEASIAMISDAVEAVLASDEVAASVRAEALDHDKSALADARAPDDMLSVNMKSAVERVVREELSGWLQHNMGKIIADAMPAGPEQTSQQKPAKKTAARTAAKTAPAKKKTKAKSGAKSGRASTKKSVPSAGRENIIPLKGRDKSS